MRARGGRVLQPLEKRGVWRIRNSPNEYFRNTYFPVPPRGTLRETAAQFGNVLFESTLDPRAQLYTQYRSVMFTILSAGCARSAQRPARRRADPPRGGGANAAGGLWSWGERNHS